MNRMKSLIAIAAAGLIVLPVAAQQSSSDHASHHSATPAEAAQTPPLTEGEVRKVDKEAKKLTIRHGPITNLDMPAMTMVFQVQDPAMLDQVKAGDKISFRVEKIGGAFTVTRIAPGN